METARAVVRWRRSSETIFSYNVALGDRHGKSRPDLRYHIVSRRRRTPKGGPPDSLDAVVREVLPPGVGDFAAALRFADEAFFLEEGFDFI